MKSAAIVIFALLQVPCVHGAAKKAPPPKASGLDTYIEEALRRPGVSTEPTGGLWSPSAPLADLARDLIASRVDDLVTIVVSERDSAVSTGTTQSARTSQVNSSVGAFGGITRAAGPLANLARGGTQTELDGQGNTSRETTLTTSLTGRVTHVLPNGYLVVEALKTIQINSEVQVVSVRGIVRPVDLSARNTVRSDEVAQLEVQISGKGVVSDAIRRPFFLYRLLLGILPF